MRFSVRCGIGLAAIAGLGVHAIAARAQVTVNGVGYAFYGYSLQPDSALVATTGSAGHDNNFDVSRSYINVNGKFSGGVVTRVTADIDGRKAAANQLSFRLKYAFVAWTPEKSNLTYKIGLIHTPWIDWEESLWDYRMQGPMAVDRNGLMTSADFGAGIDGMWNFDQVGLQLGVYNGEGYANAPGDPGKDAEGRLSVRVAKTDLAGRTGGLRLNGYAQVGTATGGGTRQRFIGGISYKSKGVTLAAEIATARDSTGSGATKNPKQKSQVLSAYGVFNLPKSNAALIARVDWYDPNTDSTLTAINSAANTTVNKQTRVIAGVSYAVTPNFRVLADVDLNSLQNGATNAFDKSRQMFFFHTEFKF